MSAERSSVPDRHFQERLAALPRRRDQALPALLLAQKCHGWLPDNALRAIGLHLKLTPNELEGIAGSYPELRREPPGARVVRVCTGLACRLAGSDTLLAALGGPHHHADLTVEEAPCCFACALAPVIEIDEVLHGRMDVAAVAGVIDPRRGVPRTPAPEARASEQDGHDASASGQRPVSDACVRGTPAREADAPHAWAALASAAERRLVARGTRLVVGAGGCGEAAGADAVVAALRDAVAGALPIVESGCSGMCHAAVQVTLQRAGHADLTWSRVTPGDAARIAAIASERQSPATFPPVLAWQQAATADAPGITDTPFLAGQRRRLFAAIGRSDPVSLDEALTRGRYRTLAHALTRPPEAVIAEVEGSELLGRGGAYAATGRKLAGCRAASGDRIIVINAEEGEPGAIKDRHLLEGDPHLVIEGALLAAWAAGAGRIVAYLNGLAHRARHTLAAAIAELRASGLLGSSVLGSGFGCDIELRLGAGGYVLGEQTALLASIEGRRSMPWPRPPQPFERGLFGQPTFISNVETFANLPGIVEHGAEAFRLTGTPRGRGTKLICLAGSLRHPGVVEVEIGTPLGTVLEMAGGMLPGRRLQAVLSGGPSGRLAPPSLLATPLEPKRNDVMLGSGNIVAIDESVRLIEVVHWLTAYNADESCGKCTPCREGVPRLRAILARAAAGVPRPGDRDDLLALCEIAATGSLCGLGMMAPDPIRSALESFGLPELDADARKEAADAHADG